MTRYVVRDGSETWICEEPPSRGHGYAIYELGPEVVEPDYGPLAGWLRERRTICGPWHAGGCHYFIASNEYECTCGLTDALDERERDEA